MKYYIIAGEASGDLHGSLLIQQIQNLDPKAQFRFWGGDKMHAASSTPPVKHYRELAFMGFVEVILNLRTIFANLSFAKKDIAAWSPDAVIFIDYPGFNLRLASFVKNLQIPTIYFISPQVWAWKSSRVHSIKKYIDLMLVILPFEQEFYERYDYPTNFVGHPLLDAIEQGQAASTASQEDFREKHGLSSKPIVALLPGSRKQEISTALPIMQSLVEQHPHLQFAVAGAPGQPDSTYQPLLHPQVTLIRQDTYNLLQNATYALVTSGTATLETALFGVPQIVCYKGNPISYAIGRRLVTNIRYISLVNLIMDREVVRELIQQDFNPKELSAEFQKLQDPEHQKHIQQEYQQLRQKLGNSGAAERAAKAIMQHLQSTK
ncbi:MAG: lipid-A-disaccharide synthase [Weeksellaceae bacterium]|nr:lipid-A-disaccharide synthase [Weeksellaceae bacterium]